jgi:hypothetical protein
MTDFRIRLSATFSLDVTSDSREHAIGTAYRIVHADLGARAREMDITIVDVEPLDPPRPGAKP